MKRLLFIGLMLWGASAFAADQEQAVGDISGGMYSYFSPNKIPDKSASYIQNFFTDIEPLATESNGFIKKESAIMLGTTTVKGLWNFTDNTGIEWVVAFSSRNFYKSNSSVSFSTFGPVAIADVSPRAAINLGKIWFTDGSIPVWSFDGTSTATVAGAPQGTLITAWRNRLAISGIANSRSTIRFSADGDGTLWSLGGNPTDPFSVQLGGANDGYDTRCIWGSYADYFVAGRKYDTYLMSGFDQSDVILRKISSEVGCIDNNSMRPFDGSLMWMSARGQEEMRGTVIQRVSDPIRNLTDVVVKNSSNLRTVTLATQSDFTPGTSLPVGYISLTAAPGSVTLSTMNATISSDTTQADFQLGSSTNTELTLSTGSVLLGLTDQHPVQSQYSTSDDFTCSAPRTATYYQAQRFIVNASSGFYLTDITMRLQKAGNSGSSPILQIMDSTSLGDLGSNILSSATVSFASVGTSPGDVDVSVPRVFLTGGATYWAQLNQPFGDSSNQILWYGHSLGAGTISSYGCGSSASVGSLVFYEYKLNGKQFVSSGTLISRTYDIAQTTTNWIWSWGNLGVTYSTTSPSNLVFQTQTSADGSNWEAVQTELVNQQIASSVQRFIRYKATFSTTDMSTSPVLNDITLPTSQFQRPSALYTSPVITVGSAITFWKPLSFSDVRTGGGSIAYQFNASTNSSIALFNSSSWTNVSNGIIPSNGVASFAAIRATFTVTAGTDTARMQNFSVSWQEGGYPALASVVYDGRYYLSVTTTIAGTPMLDTLLVYQRNRTWTMIKGVNASSLSLWQDKMYFGNSIGNGLVYQYDIGNNYDGQAITSIIKTKSYDYGIPSHDKSFRTLFLEYGGSTSKAGSFTTTYDIDHAGSAFTLGSADISEGNGLQSVRLPFTLNNPVEGKEIQYTLTKSGTGDRLKLMDFVTVFSVKDAR